MPTKKLYLQNRYKKTLVERYNRNVHIHAVTTTTNQPKKN